MTPAPEMKDEIRRNARALGFDGVRFTRAQLPEHIGAHLEAFLECGRHGDMTWLQTRARERKQPTALWPDVKSVIMLSVNYGPDGDPLAGLKDKTSGGISVYAQNKDYHEIIKKRLKQLARKIAADYGGEVKVFVDTAPVMEKPLAAQAGLGWQGKHTNLVSREYGSWLFLSAIYTTLNIDPDPHETDHCGQCRKCLDICPTDAFTGPYQIDARRCISYLTIEHKGPIPLEFRKPMGNRIYGCDDCLAVCPWNKFASLSHEAGFHARDELRRPALGELAQLDDQSFRTLFSRSPVKRTGYARFMRNVLIAIGNSGERHAARHAFKHLKSENPLIRGAAVWALSELLTPEEFTLQYEENFAGEKNEAVVSEWRAGYSRAKILKHRR